MLIYNILSGLTALQFLILASLEALFLVLSCLVFKKKPTFKIFLFSALAAGVLTLLSSLIGRGNYGGMMYHERLGWPFPFLTVSRSIEAGALAAVPFSSHFDPLKFLATSAFWAIFPLCLLLNAKSEKRFRLFTAFFLTVFILLTMIFCLNNIRSTQESREPPIPEAVLPDTATPDPKIVQFMREKIEKAYPEFADFENQPSLAGQSVQILLEDGEYYFAYLTHGSGIPIIKATCFRVDSWDAYKIGKFPNPLDSYRGYPAIDPKTCKGIR